MQILTRDRGAPARGSLRVGRGHDDLAMLERCRQGILRFQLSETSTPSTKALPMAAIYFAKDALENRLHCFKIENCLVDIEHGQWKSGHVSRLQC
jgi:hypothetical protein